MAGENKKSGQFWASSPPPKKPKAKSFGCPSCAAPIPLRAIGQTVTVSCPSCLAIIDPRDESLKIISAARKAKKFTPTIALGSRGKMMGDVWEVIGFMRRCDESEQFKWTEYLLFNPRKGFRWLVEDSGHWSFIMTMRGLPEQASSLNREYAVYDGKRYALYNKAKLKVLYVEGEFYWRVLLTDISETSDYISPPLMLSVESTKDEIICSRGIYIDANDVFDTFGIEEKTRKEPKGVAPHQPSPYDKNWRTLRNLFFFYSLTMVAVYYYRSSENVIANATLFEFTHNTAQAGTSLVSAPFKLNGPTSGVDIRLSAALENNWIELEVDLINDETGQSFEIGKTLERYTGVDSDGAWSEGTWNDTVELDRVPSGTYHLNIDAQSSKPGEFGTTFADSIRFDVQVDRSRLGVFSLFMMIGLLMIPFGIYYFVKYSFEVERWENSDYSPYES